jgi:long-subunit fatty acid transport protein
MKRLTYIFSLCSLLLVPCSGLRAQDLQRFAERQIAGTARYVGMGGAMTAIGGVPSAVLDNPAGLGLYRRSELSVTLDETIDRTSQVYQVDTYQRTRLGIPHTSAIWSLGNPNKQQGIIFNNLMFSIHRLASFNRDVVVEGESLGLSETVCQKTNGLPDIDLVPDQATEYDPWYNEDIGWLSILGFSTYLIDPDTTVLDAYLWKPAVDFTHGTLSVSESGSCDQYTLSWAGNINNQWYVGVSMNIPTLSYTKHISLCEAYRDNSAELRSMFHASGVGIGGSVGLIYRPIESFRVGASVQTPTMMMLSVQTEGDMYTTIRGENYEYLTPSSGSIRSEILSPLRASVGIAGQIGNTGLVSLQYDYAHSADMYDVHTLRLGAEAQVHASIFLNAGYVYESSFVQEQLPVGLSYKSIRTDTDSRFCAGTQYASVGLGYRNNRIAAHVAYQYRWQLLHQYATEMQSLPIDVRARTHRIVATLAWRF